ncbi:MAG: iron-sulfur cluster-binding domain-containing protein [Vicinamibacterales bacterium]
MSAVSFLFAGSPWLLPSPTGIVVGFAAHIAWFIACERLLNTPSLQAIPTAPATRAAPLKAPSPPIGVAKAARTRAKVASIQPKGFVQVSVMAVFDETPDIKTFRLARPEGFNFTAGQFLTVRLRTDGREHVRCYSISSSPSASGYAEISVKRIGHVSSALHASLRPGSLLTVRAPAGSFLYPTDDERPLVLLAGGVGITPLMSMLRYSVEADPGRPVTLFYSVRRAADVAFKDELTLLSKRNAHVRIFIAISDDIPEPGQFPGFISQELVTTTVPDVAHAVCLICGPPPMMTAMTSMLTSVGVPNSQIRFEVFQAAVAVASRPDTVMHSPLVSDTAVGETSHDVSFERSHRRTTITDAQTLLEAAEACGAEIPSLCRAGVCGTCRTRVLSGETHCSSSVLDDEDRAAGYVLACVTQVASHCSVEA